MAIDLGLDSVVDVNISVADRSVSTSNFSTPVIVDAHNVFTERTRIYSNTTAMISDGFAAGSAAVTMAGKNFSGSNAPRTVVVGRRAITAYTVTPDVANSTDYTVYMKCVVSSVTYTKTFTFTSDADATAAEIAIGLAALIEGDTDIGGSVAATNNSGVLTIVPSVPTSVGVGTTNLTLGATSSEALADTMTAITGENAAWFFINSTARSDADILALAGYAETNERFYVTSTNDTVAWTSGTSDIAYQLEQLSYNNTLVVASVNADKEFPEGAVVGSLAGSAAGSTILYARTLTGITIDDFTETQLGYIKGKNGNAYIRRASLGWFEDGKMVSGRYADIQYGILWLKANIQEAIANYIQSQVALNKKVGYDDSGIQAIDAVIQERLAVAKANGLLGSYKTYPPLAADVSNTDKSARSLTVEFTAELLGAIQNVTVNGFVGY